ncbi:MAG: protein-glutamate O-methyltransferase CheR [Acidobacteriia bacterium]|nr:protein-glutamate O-methyltransferase CheR [Terriglobia bacterium]
MNTLSTSVLEHELSELRLILERQAGVLLDTPAEILSDVLRKYLLSKHQGSVQDMLSLLRSSDAECERLLEPLLDPQTGFFRYPQAFEALATLVLPDLQTRKLAENPHSLRVWSAGCSSGEEAYSIAMSVCDALNCNGGGWNVRIIGSDIRRPALEVAQRGLYPESGLQQVSRQRVQTYFVRVGQHLLVKPRVRNLVTFTPMNLAKPDYLGRFDCIFCMDVLPHFSMSQRVALTQRLHLYLEPGGYLFLGQNEKLPAVDVAFRPHKTGSYTLYQKPMAAAAGQGR